MAATVVVGGGDSAAGPMKRRSTQVSPQLRAISLEYSYAELATATQNWHPSRKLGTGCYGAVFRGELKDGSEVAIKAIDLGALMDKGEYPEDAGFDDEVQMLSKFRHPHLVTLLGWGHHGLLRYLIYEFLSGGDVFQRLHKARTKQKLFTWSQRLSVLLDAATGLSHMHNSTPKAFHRDIKSANILLDRHGTAKMADFGLSCLGQAGAKHVTVKTISGTPGYKCPNYERTGRFTEGSEVYSFGMVMLEVLTGLDPSAADSSVPGGISYPISEQLAPSSAGAYERVIRALDPVAGWPQALGQEVAQLSLRAVSGPDERLRPHFVEIVKALRSMQERYPASAPAPLAPPATAVQVSHQAAAAAAPAAIAPAAAPAAPVPALAPQAQPAKVVPMLPIGISGSESNFRSARLSGGYVSPKGSSTSAATTTAPPSGSPLSPKDMTGKATPLVRNGPAPTFCMEATFQLEFIASEALSDPELLPPEARAILLTPKDGQPMRAVGRFEQIGHFEAWLPQGDRRSCISRRALEISWSGFGGSAWLLACGINPLSVNDTLVQKGSSVQLQIGSVIRFMYEGKVILQLRFNEAPPNSSASAGASGSALVESPLLVSRLFVTNTSASLLAKASATPEAGRSQHVSLMSQPVSPQRGALKQMGEGSPKSVSGLTVAFDSPTARRAPVWRLKCISSEGLKSDIFAALSPLHRELELPNGTSLLGRPQQLEALEALLPDARQRAGIVKTPLEFMALPGQLSVTNTAGALISVDEVPLSAGETCQLKKGQVLAFLKPEGAPLIEFTVHQDDSTSADPRSALKHASMATTVLSAPFTQEGAVLARAKTQEFKLMDESPASGLSWSPDQGAGEEQSREEQSREAVSVPVVLDLHGDGVRDVPQELRRIGPMRLGKTPVMIGRRHQKAIHERAIKEELCDYISRDCFSISWEGGQFRLVGKASNPLWLDRDSDDPLPLQRESSYILKPGDRIVLSTGSDVPPFPDARRRLRWVFLLDTSNLNLEKDRPQDPWWLPGPGR